MFSIFKSNKKAGLQEIQQMQALDSMQVAHEDYHQFVNQEAVQEILLELQNQDDVFSKNEVLSYLGNLFHSIEASLKNSTLDAKAIKAWSRVLRELLVSIHYTGEYLEAAKNIKEQLDSQADILKSTQDTKDLLIAFSSSLTEDHEAMHGYLVSITNKLQSIYTDITQAKDDY